MHSPLVPIHSIASIRAGYQTRSGVEEAAKGSHYLIQIRDFNDSRTELKVDNLVRIEPGTINPAHVLREGDVLFLAKGSKNFAFALKSLPPSTLAASYFFILRPEQALIPDFLVWFLNLDSTRRVLTLSTGHSAHMPVVRRDVLENLQLPLPPVHIQNLVVELDQLMRRQQQLLAELAVAQKALLTETCVRLAQCNLLQQPTHD